MNNKTDRRKLRTKKLLRQALIELMEEKGLEKITVSDLANRADINRGTFYLHYEDVHDFIEQQVHEFLNQLSELASKVQFTDLLLAAERDEPFPGLISIIEHWERNADFCKWLLGPKGDPSFVLRVKELMKQRLFIKLSGLEGTDSASELQVPLEYLIAYVTSANVGVLQHWFHTGRIQTPTEIHFIMIRLISKGWLSFSGVRHAIANLKG
ncbi:TetR/AcrR family transcriptional regulator [Paenibacillus sp. J5C_2022]|uniref:TetR/AcrR family transcriptional regulator n=1 Tax=Paenibacillus sp. J5C2022 TaxID=2977129 RepID=UPI0021D34569|nr:TetR/AcrR family transcriptional regulator [Paenibacillus sp. J5C2022]MCU6707381.1 TetR/AcrR family transcriptional regulator [Paenibacillus sp. J5C2022]